MGLFGKSKTQERLEQIESKQSELVLENNKLKDLNAMYLSFRGHSAIYDGEKTPNELGTPIDYVLAYQSMRLRAWEALIKSSVVQLAIKNYCLWIVGSGLKFSCEPNEEFLGLKGIKFDKKDFANKVEAQFRLFAKDKEACYSKEMNLHVLASEALKNAILSGDVLIIARYKNYQPTYQIIDGGFIETPFDYINIEREYGTKIINGVEVNETGEHVAYHVKNIDNKFDRILANPTGRKGARQAWLMYGSRYKINDTRGMSLLTAVLERDAKLDRFIEATVGAAEENGKIPYTFEHSQYSDGSNPMIKNVAQAAGITTKSVVNETATCDGYATKIAQTTGKQVYNLPVGSQLKAHTNTLDPNFERFYAPNAELIYATIGIPSEVALSKYGGSYSGSRAAIKGWEFKIRVEREVTLTDYFYKPIYQFWFLINFYKGNIEAPGFREAIVSYDWLVRSAYTQCKFIGQSVPHIDPVKEATAERIKLGAMYDNIPLQTGEQACENGNAGDFNEVQKIVERELEGSTFTVEKKEETTAFRKIINAVIEKNVTENLEN